MLSVKDLSIKYIINLFEKSIYYKSVPEPNLYQNKILMNIFFEPSTRTMLSFESAMYKLGGKVITFNKDISSINKGETFYDTMKTLSSYADIFVIRHPEIDKVQEAQKIINKPVINGGDGYGEHPTQALLDLFTIYQNINIFDKNQYNILFVGDINKSRTIHSLIYLLENFPTIKIYLLPYDGCHPDNFLLNKFDLNNITIINNLENIDIFDVIYYTRYQKERHNNNIDIPKELILDSNKLKKIKQNAIIMHPLPRNNEINSEIDNDSRCKYFTQLEDGVYLRMAIINSLINSSSEYVDIKKEHLFEISKW